MKNIPVIHSFLYKKSNSPYVVNVFKYFLGNYARDIVGISQVFQYKLERYFGTTPAGNNHRSDCLF